MAIDGAITLSTALDNKQLERELNALTKRIEKLRDNISQKESERSPLIENAEQLKMKIVEATKEAERYNAQWQAGVLGADGQEGAARERVKALNAEYDQVLKKIEKYDTAILKSTGELEKQECTAGEIVQRLAEVNAASNQMGWAIDQASGYMDKFLTRVKQLAYRAFVFTVISKALRAMRDGIAKVIKTNNEAVQAINRLKGALLTMVQPLVNIMIPAFVFLVNILAQLASVAAQLFSMIFGTTITESKKAAEGLNKEVNALDAVGDAAKDAGKQLAGFDELNVLSTSQDQGGGATSAPDFGFEASMTDEQLTNILGLVKAVAAGLLAWKLGTSLFDGLAKFVGMLLFIDGTIGLVKETMDAWTNGVSWDNFMGMLGRSTEIVLGLWIAFGKAGAAVGLIVTGLVMLGTAFHDAAENGWGLENSLMAITGLLGAGLGISILVGSWVPLLIAGIASLLLAITIAFGHGEELIEGLQTILEGFKDFFVGIFTGDIEMAIGGLGKIFEGLKTVFAAVLDSLAAAVTSFFDWLNEKTGGRLTFLITLVKSYIVGVVSWIKDTLNSLIDAAKTILEGFIIFFSGVFTGDWDKALEGLVQVLKGAVNLMITLVEGFVNFFINGLNAVLSAINSIHFEVPDWVPGFGGKSFGPSIPLIPKFTLPRLATGAVIPPNREFMAVLGDQKRGVNIEAPLDTIVAAVMTALDKSDFGGGDTIIDNILKLDGEVIYRNQQRVARRRGKNLVKGLPG